MFYTNRLLRQTTLHQAPFSPSTFYTKQLLHHSYTKRLLHNKPFTPRAFCTTHTFYSKHHANTGATQTPGSLRGVLATQAKAPEHSTGTPREHPGHTQGLDSLGAAPAMQKVARTRKDFDTCKSMSIILAYFVVRQ